MQQFSVGRDGRLSETAATRQASWFGRKSHTPNELDFEAHFMLMRGFDAIKADSPFERKSGISKARFSVLRILYQADDHRMVMSDIVQSLNVSPTNITKLVDALECAGLVRRLTTPVDKRRVWVELLPAGQQVVDDLLPDVVNHIHGLWSSLTAEEKRILIHLLSKLRLGILTGAALEDVEYVRDKHLSPASDLPR
jgi:MarR family 2-MHQ and catechol resistance regulon transcriptional repressor